MENSTLIILLAVGVALLGAAILIPARREVAMVLAGIAMVLGALVALVVLVR